MLGRQIGPEIGADNGFLLWHATLRWQRDVAQTLAPLELTYVL